MQFSHLVSFVVSIIMLVSGYIAQLYNAILCVLWAYKRLLFNYKIYAKGNSKITPTNLSAHLTYLVG